MDKAAVLTIIDDFQKALLCEQIRPQKIILFGSYACGTARPDSDIDLIVVSDDFEDKDYWQRIDILSSAVYKVFKPIEAVAMTTREWQRGDSRMAELARDGQVVYG